MLISKSKKNCLREYFQENYNSSKNIWTKTNEFLNNKHKKSREVIINGQSGSIITDEEIVANKFSNYFVNVAQNILKGLAKSNNNFQDHLKNQNENRFFLKEIDHGEVKEFLRILM